MKDFKNDINGYIEREIDVLRSLDLDSVNDVMNAILDAHDKNTNIYIFGNGGSASTASHFANDFNKGISEYIDNKFRFVCLNDNVPTVMAIANDLGYENIFSFQLQNKLEPGDLVIGISGSGNSPNILKAIEYAKSCNVKTVGVTGYDGGKLAKIVDISFHVNINDMQITEDVHMILDHLMMSVFMKTLIKGKNKK